MIDQRIVGAIIAGDLRGYRLTAGDVRVVTANRVATDVQRLLDQGRASATPEAGEMLTGASRRAAVRSMTQAMTASRVARILDEAEIPALTYKGVTLAMELHGDWRGRESSDVDVLIAPADINRTHQALTSAGLTRSGGDPSPPSAFRRFRAFEVPYGGLPVTVDLHWYVESPGYYRVPFQDLWDRRKRFSGDGLEVWSPSRADMVLIAALHGTREGWRSLRHILDFAKLAVGTEASEWSLAGLLSRHGPQRSLAVALGVARACGVEGLPAQPGPWAQRMASKYLSGLDTALESSLGPRAVVRRTPQAAVRRRLLRWQVAPSPAVAADALFRSALRQVGYGKRSWQLAAEREVSPTSIAWRDDGGPQ